MLHDKQGPLRPQAKPPRSGQSTPLCLLEQSIPPEAPPPYETEVLVYVDAMPYRRFAEPDQDGVIWQPDDAPPGRLASSESLLLEYRGITAPNAAADAVGTRQPAQAEIWRASTMHKNSVAAKLRQQGLTEEASRLEQCHSYYTFARCADCGRTAKFPNRCDRFYCPECSAHLQHERHEQIAWWLSSVRQPKHVILTVRNIPQITRGHVDQMQRWFGALRRRKFARNWTGGFYCMEITNEKRGWHLHIHALVEARWIDKGELARVWNSVTNGMGRIVDVRDYRKAEFLPARARYIVKGSALAKWPAAEVAEFVRAFQGKRTFGVFGSLYAQRTQFAEFIAEMKAARPRCECGSNRVKYYSETEWLMLDLEPEPAPRPPPVLDVEAQNELIPQAPPWQNTPRYACSD